MYVFRQRTKNKFNQHRKQITLTSSNTSFTPLHFPFQKVSVSFHKHPCLLQVLGAQANTLYNYLELLLIRKAFINSTSFKLLRNSLTLRLSLLSLQGESEDGMD